MVDVLWETGKANSCRVTNFGIVTHLGEEEIFKGQAFREPQNLMEPHAI